MNKTSIRAILLTVAVSTVPLFLSACGGKDGKSPASNNALKAYECRKTYASRIVNTDFRKSKAFYVSDAKRKEIEQQLVNEGCPEGFLDRNRH